MTILDTTLSRTSPWDLAGIGASLLCILHCVATPMLVVVLPALEVLERQTHAVFALSILCIGLLAFVPGYRRHRRWRGLHGGAGPRLHGRCRGRLIRARGALVRHLGMGAQFVPEALTGRLSRRF